MSRSEPACECWEKTAVSKLCPEHRQQRERILARRRARKKRHGGTGDPTATLTPGEADALLAALNDVTRSENFIRRDLDDRNQVMGPALRRLFTANHHVRRSLARALRDVEIESIEVRRKDLTSAYQPEDDE